MTLRLQQGLCRLSGQEDGLLLRDDLLVLGLRGNRDIVTLKLGRGYSEVVGSSPLPQDLQTSMIYRQTTCFLLTFQDAQYLPFIGKFQNRKC